MEERINETRGYNWDFNKVGNTESQIIWNDNTMKTDYDYNMKEIWVFLLLMSWGLFVITLSKSADSYFYSIIAFILWIACLWKWIINDYKYPPYSRITFSPNVLCGIIPMIVSLPIYVSWIVNQNWISWNFVWLVFWIWAILLFISLFFSDGRHYWRWIAVFFFIMNILGFLFALITADLSWFGHGRPYRSRKWFSWKSQEAEIVRGKRWN